MIFVFFFITGYMLEVDPDLRPDIFQVSYVAFRISQHNTPVPNLNVSHRGLSSQFTLNIPSDCCYCSHLAIDFLVFCPHLSIASSDS